LYSLNLKQNKNKMGNLLKTKSLTTFAESIVVGVCLVGVLVAVVMFMPAKGTIGKTATTTKVVDTITKASQPLVTKVDSAITAPSKQVEAPKQTETVEVKHVVKSVKKVTKPKQAKVSDERENLNVNY
jgi:hypothetical protein